MLNSGVPRKVFGRIESAQLQQLDAYLTKNNRPTLICFHHHPILMESNWIDSQKIENADELLAIAHRHKQVKVLAWGHVHQQSEQQINDVLFVSTPSTCFQFKPRQHHYQLDELLPGYRWFELAEDGNFTTGVCRVDVDDYHIDTNSAGY